MLEGRRTKVDRTHRFVMALALPRAGIFQRSPLLVPPQQQLISTQIFDATNIHTLAGGLHLPLRLSCIFGGLEPQSLCLPELPSFCNISSLSDCEISYDLFWKCPLSLHCRSLVTVPAVLEVGWVGHPCTSGFQVSAVPSPVYSQTGTRRLLTLLPVNILRQ